MSAAGSEMVPSTEDASEELEWPMARVRSTFISFFVDHPKYPHRYWSSSPCVPHDDPTLLFTNAGMNQYKSIFLGTVDPSLELSTLKRAANSQKCIRAGGKHNDLEDVGKDVYHHTFFEMLGNWSFGDYFKEEAIEMAWTCLTVVFSMDPERLYASYFGGDESSPCDEETRELWLRHLPPERVLPFDASDNFWEMGATGPCGPCTEIHYDRVGNRDAAGLVNADDPDVIEIWNNVFIQFNREQDGSLKSLPSKHIDTGMGFERLVSILQNVNSNYDTDIFKPLFEEIRIVTGAQPYTGRIGDQDVDFKDMAYRVVADHLRTLCFSMADGAVPSNDGRGYVLRRVLRRAVRYGRQNLGAELGFFATLVPKLIEVMGDVYPELVDKQSTILQLIREEEQSFSTTLDRGLVKFDQLANMTEGKVFSAEDAHFLYTSMGFPLDLTQLMAEERGLVVDVAAYQRKMKEEQDLSSRAHKLKLAGGIEGGADMTMEALQTSHLMGRKIKPTDDTPKYHLKELPNCAVRAIYLGRNNSPDGTGLVDALQPSGDSRRVAVVLDKTSFYAEAGGQVHDTGSILLDSISLPVQSVQSYAGYVLHVFQLPPNATLALGDEVTCLVDYSRRHLISSNHTMTHVLNQALRHVLIPPSSQQTIDQKGSLNDQTKLRFDFSYSGPISPDHLLAVEKFCQSSIAAGHPVRTSDVSLSLARPISSLRAVFGEAYPDPVRVVSIGPHAIEDMMERPSDPAWMGDSVEFCGGTHLANTALAEHFVLLNEEGIAKGIRRITAVTKDEAREALRLSSDFGIRLTGVETEEDGCLETSVKVLVEELKGLSIGAPAKLGYQTRLTALTKRVLKWKKARVALLSQEVTAFVLQRETATPSDKIVLRYDFGTDAKIAKTVMTAHVKKGKKPLLLISAEGDKFIVLACAPKSFQDKKFDCKQWIVAGLGDLEGRGGGKKDAALYTVLKAEGMDLVLDNAKLY